jgi:8-oxo-dGTP pyrophosphatase MutT (NUDIX family)
MEKGETPHETALRETNEETGISDVEFIDGFEEEIEYYFYANNQEIHKKVIFFLGKTKTSEIILSHEHLDYIWLEFDNALEKTTYENAKNLLKKSKVFLENRISD